MASAALALPVTHFPNWSYDGDSDGQDDWGTLSPAYNACLSGTAQSPLVISYTKVAKLPPLHTQYADSIINMQAKEWTISLAISGKNTLLYGGERYTLDEIRFHSPSEHTIRDKFYPLEIHLIHHNAQGNTLIVAVFAEQGTASATLAPLISRLPAATVAADFSFNPAGLLPSARGYYAYSGSLTTPPCHEGVEWRLFKQPITLSHEQLAALTHQLQRNARLPQPVYMRTVSESQE